MKIKMSFSEKLLTIHRQKLDTIEQSTINISQRKKLNVRHIRDTVTSLLVRASNRQRIKALSKQNQAFTRKIPPSLIKNLQYYIRSLSVDC